MAEFISPYLLEDTLDTTKFIEAVKTLREPFIKVHGIPKRGEFKVEDLDGIIKMELLRFRREYEYNIAFFNEMSKQNLTQSYNNLVNDKVLSDVNIRTLWNKLIPETSDMATIKSTLKKSDRENKMLNLILTVASCSRLMFCWLGETTSRNKTAFNIFSAFARSNSELFFSSIRGQSYEDVVLGAPFKDAKWTVDKTPQIKEFSSTKIEVERSALGFTTFEGIADYLKILQTLISENFRLQSSTYKLDVPEDSFLRERLLYPYRSIEPKLISPYPNLNLIKEYVKEFKSDISVSNSAPLMKMCVKIYNLFIGLPIGLEMEYTSAKSGIGILSIIEACFNTLYYPRSRRTKTVFRTAFRHFIDVDKINSENFADIFEAAISGLSFERDPLSEVYDFLTKPYTNTMDNYLYFGPKYVTTEDEKKVEQFLANRSDTLSIPLVPELTSQCNLKVRAVKQVIGNDASTKVFAMKKIFGKETLEENLRMAVSLTRDWGNHGGDGKFLDGEMLKVLYTAMGKAEISEPAVEHPARLPDELGIVRRMKDKIILDTEKG